ncbi:MAG TPA: transglycosylase domain-containing protein [Bacteroidota bacterium]|nr:transglycosylase domain-containing protein [Bacteroidota bacterium]
MVARRFNHYLYRIPPRCQMIKIILALVAFGLVGAGVSLFVPLGRDLFSPERNVSLRITDRHGELLREVLSARDGRGRWCLLSELTPDFVNAVVATEDARFYWHAGVDPLAVLRATWQNIRAGRIVSGGSTITMQVVRNVLPSRRTFWGKIREAWYALRLERMMTKNEILLQYLNRVPFGNQTFGVDAAARLYFGKPPAQLSVAEAAFLAALPNAPSLSDPYRNFQTARRRQLHVLARMEAEGFLSPEERERAQQEPLVLVPRTASFKAPHFTTMILQSLTAEERAGLEEIRTTLDYSIQQTAERLVQAHLARLRHHDAGNAALVVIDNASREVLALVGSRDFSDTTIQGQVNGALALRQPGSTLKPFTYGMALERGLTAATVLADVPRTPAKSEVDFLPENYDRKYHGPVRLRTALACSYNVPAVQTLEMFGEELLLRTLHAAGFTSLHKSAAHYGLGLTLGNGEVTLLELAGRTVRLPTAACTFRRN